MQNDEGPCLDCYASGEPVRRRRPGRRPATDVAAVRRRGDGAGFRSVVALPLRLRNETIGALNLFRARTGPLVEGDRSLAQALADVATIGILQERGSSSARAAGPAAPGALSSRIVIEQAKGVLAERAGVHVDAAFQLLRGYARSHGLQLSEVARRVVARDLDLDRTFGGQPDG